MVNFILGLGGTGAKVVESFVHLCGTGLGPPSSRVAFVDQDRANGNTDRARKALARYGAARKALLTGVGERDRQCRLLDTRLEPFPDADNADNCHWVPQAGQDTTLAGLMSYNLMQEGERNAARVFFRHDEELQMNLNEGYRGRPHIGSAALLMQIEDDPFWQFIGKFVETADSEVRVFVCGSAFGGTGAAILPTLARRLRQVAENEKKRLYTGAALMLPYFTFPPPEKSGEDNVAAGHELRLQSQAALRYYQEEMEAGRPYGFDDLYMVGWDPAIELSYHAPGAQIQENPALAPELFGALAAARFFGQERRDDAGGGRGLQRPALHVISREERSRLEWDDIPEVGDGKKTAPAYQAWLRFCWLWHFNYGRAFEDAPAGARDEAWFRRILGDGVVPDEGVRDFGAYVSSALRYAAAMSAFSAWDASGDGGSFELWGHGPIAAVDRAKPYEEPTLNPRKSVQMADLERLDPTRDRSLPKAEDVYWELSRQPRRPSGWRRLAVLLHGHVRPAGAVGTGSDG